MSHFLILILNFGFKKYIITLISFLLKCFCFFFLRNRYVLQSFENYNCNSEASLLSPSGDTMGTRVCGVGSPFTVSGVSGPAA